MANKMIIDASHPEETRVVVLRGNRVEEFDFESANKRPLRGNIYLAKVTRVEPSLQAAFVDYGGNRHGFLAFSEIHPDYYQIPIADRQALLEEEALSQRDEEDEPNGERRSRRHRRQRHQEIEARISDGETLSEPASSEHLMPDENESATESPTSDAFAENDPSEGAPAARENPESLESSDEVELSHGYDRGPTIAAVEREEAGSDLVEFPVPEAEAFAPAEPSHDEIRGGDSHPDKGVEEHSHDDDDHEVTTLEGGSEERFARNRKDPLEDEGEPVEQIGGDAMEEVPRRPQRLRRQYKIQEVIKRRQVLLVQVVKEERGNKGAALTTYLSLAGRYSVLMPNTARGGGISRKITNAQDRSRLKGIAEELDVPEGMGVILRTAGASRTKAEVKRDFEYLLRMWETVRETTLASSAPTLVYEEGSLIKRAIRDLYSKEVDEIIVAGEAGHREARQFMRLLMPSHVNSVQLYRDTQPVFAKAGVETQLDAMFSNQVTLKSGGYIVINQTEALVAIDVNSGRSTREHNIEDTALRTNIEAADEIARQLRLRDLAGLVVVDFIDMEESRNNRAVERRIKDALKNDRARIQVGRISHFGLLEMSRQRIRTGVLEGSTVICPHCQGAGVVRSTASIALHVLRALEDALIKSSTHDVVIRTRTTVALYILNQKRANLRDLERRFGIAITIEADDTLTGANYYAIERGEIATGVKGAAEPPPPAQDDFAISVEEPALFEEGVEEESEPLAEGGDVAEAGQRGRDGAGPTEEGELARRRRRRRRRRGGERSFGQSIAPDAPQPTDDGLAVVAEIGGDLESAVESVDSVDRRGSRSEGARSSRRSRRSRGPRSHFPAHDEGVHEANVSEPLDAIEPGLDLQSGSAPELVSSDEVEGRRAAQPPTMEGPELPQGWHQEPKSPAPAATEPSATVEETRVPSASPAAQIWAEPGPESAPAAEEPPRPRRSGWWQRARASIVGD
ncbi:MAG TPA: Rne/Rng family ribonuclease [Roseiarcus sp.]|nr:Rne/Rng family ribonuclease [Roseiarcus sp.]